MTHKIQVSASILCADFTKLGEEIKKSEESGCDMIHVDVMDGHFVANITIGPVILQAIRPLTRLPIEAHLMIERPGAYADAFIDAGADIISIHAECFPVREEILVLSRKIRKRGKKVFLAFNPKTPIDLEEIGQEMDGILVMSVNPGFAGQKFIPEVLPKIQALRKVFPGEIAVDGGVNDLTAEDAVKAGANILVTASYFFNSKTPKTAVDKLKNLP